MRPVWGAALMITTGLCDPVVNPDAVENANLATGGIKM
jgi:hypothetical protein